MKKEDAAFRDWLVRYLAERLSRDFKDVKVNTSKEKNHEYKGHFPDLILGNYGITLAILEVETEGSISKERMSEIKTLSNLGVKLILMVPKDMKNSVVEMLWKEGIAAKVSVGTYEVNINLP